MGICDHKNHCDQKVKKNVEFKNLISDMAKMQQQSASIEERCDIREDITWLHGMIGRVRHSTFNIYFND